MEKNLYLQKRGIIMSDIKIPFSPPDISEEEIAEVVDTLRSGWITTGPKTKDFERKIAEYCNTSKAVCLNSGTACLEMTLRLFEIGEGDEIITSAYTYTASASVAAHVGADLVLVDTASASCEMDYDQMERCITEKTKAIIPVDIAGIPCDYKKIYEIVERKRALFKPKGRMQKAMGRIAILADSAHGFGAESAGKRTGTLADFTSFSFHAVKNLTTAEGGAVTWKSLAGISDDEIYKKYMLYSLHGQSKDALSKTKLGAWEYDVIGPYYKCNMTDLQAAIGLAQLRRYSGMLKRRHEIISKYNKAFSGHGIETLTHRGENYRSSGHLYFIRPDGIDEQQRNEIIEKLAQRGIASNVHYKPLPMLTAYRKMGFDINDYPRAFEYYKNEITIPLYSMLKDKQVEYIIESVNDIVKEYV